MRVPAPAPVSIVTVVRAARSLTVVGDLVTGHPGHGDATQGAPGQRPVLEVGRVGRPGPTDDQQRRHGAGERHLAAGVHAVSFCLSRYLGAAVPVNAPRQ